jgi:hypothetical protein
MTDYECIICLEESCPHDLKIHSSNRIIRLCMSSCECNGFIHVKCLKDWISRDESTNKTKCPICRTRGENFTLLECTTPIPVYQPPILSPTSTPTPSAPSITNNTYSSVQPPDVYQYPQPATPSNITQHSRTGPLSTPLPTIQEESRSRIIVVSEEQRGFDMSRAQEQEQSRELQKQKVFAGIVIFIIIIIVVWAARDQC